MKQYILLIILLIFACLMYYPIITENLDKQADEPVDQPTEQPTDQPSDIPADEHTDMPSDGPSDIPSDEPTDEPADMPADNQQPNNGNPDTDIPTGNKPPINDTKTKPMNGYEYKRDVKGNEDSPSVKAAGEFLGLQDQMIDNLQLQSTTTLGDIDANSLNIINANRNKALKSLQSQMLVEDTLRPKLQVEDELVNNVEDELGKTRKLFDNKNAYFSFRRQTEINNYYNKRAEAYQRLFKMSIIFLVFLMIIGFFQNRGTISANIGNLLTLIILVIAGIYVIAEYYDIQRRDNMNFEEYDYGDADVGGGGGGDGDDGKSTKWGLCVNQNCCTDGMVFKNGRCRVDN